MLPWSAQRPGRKPGSQGRPETTDEEEPTGHAGRRLLCAACQSPVTASSARMEVSGSHCHTFCNPHGLVFEIGCFGEAPGAASSGLPDNFFSWFPGYAWRAAVCRGCLAHLGWSYGDEEFWGLVLDRLIEDESRPEH